MTKKKIKASYIVGPPNEYSNVKKKLWKSSGNNVDDQTPDEDYDYVMYG